MSFHSRSHFQDVDRVQHCGKDDDCSRDLKTGDLRPPKQRFRFFDLPIEIRLKILELLLVKTKVALLPTHLKNAGLFLRDRFPDWNHEPPGWNLVQGLNRQMQREASDVLYSAKNLFVLPLAYASNRESLVGPLPPKIKRLDIGFDMRDIDLDRAAALSETKEYLANRTPPVEVHDLPSQELLAETHEIMDLRMDTHWAELIETCLKLDLDVLHIDLTNCRCPLGCCRKAVYVVFHVEHALKQNGSLCKCPQRIELAEAHGHDRMEIEDWLLKPHYYSPLKGRAFLAEGRSYTYRASSVRCRKGRIN